MVCGTELVAKNRIISLIQTIARDQNVEQQSLEFSTPIIFHTFISIPFVQNEILTVVFDISSKKVYHYKQKRESCFRKRKKKNWKDAPKVAL